METYTGCVILNGLNTRVLGRSLVYLDTVDSTNLEARRLLAAGCADGTVVIASVQTAGRGRRGRRWVSQAGCGLWMSAVIATGMPLEEVQKLTLLTAAAVCRALAHCTAGAVTPQIKWPNDILACDRKICGILCESTRDQEGRLVAVAGIGINTRTPERGYGEASAMAISLEQAAGMYVEEESLAAAVLNAMEELLDAWRSQGFAPIAALYRQFMVPAGSEVMFGEGDRRKLGRIEGLDDGGGLLVRLADGETERIISGEISVGGVSGHV